MAIDKKMFRTRTLTAAVFALVMLGGLFINGYTFLALFTIVALGCVYEIIKIIRLIKLVGWGLYLLPGLLYVLVPIALIISLGFTFMWDGDGDIKGSYSPILPIAIILSIWINDTMAYLVGSMIGKTPFSKISPKKTWEGTAGGVILCIVVMAILGSTIPVLKTIALQHWICIAAIAGIAGTLGDLLESKLKRMANIKDSGSFMPGHGGFLDRFDSLLIATPFVWLYVWLFMY